MIIAVPYIPLPLQHYEWWHCVYIKHYRLLRVDLTPHCSFLSEIENAVINKILCVFDYSIQDGEVNFVRLCTCAEVMEYNAIKNMVIAKVGD